MCGGVLAGYQSVVIALLYECVVLTFSPSHHRSLNAPEGRPVVWAVRSQTSQTLHQLPHIHTHSSITGEVRHRWGAIRVQTSWYLITVISPIMRHTHTHSLCPCSHAARSPLLKYTYTAARNNTHTVSLANRLTTQKWFLLSFLIASFDVSAPKARGQKLNWNN